MPEGDTLARTAAGLRPYLVGKAITAASAPAPGPQVERLVGATVTEVEAAGKNLMINVNFTDLQQEYGLIVENAVLNYSPGPVPNANARLSLAKSTLDQIQLGDTTIDEATASGDLVIDGQRGAFNEFMGLLDTYEFWFNIVTP